MHSVLRQALVASSSLVLLLICPCGACEDTKETDTAIPASAPLLSEFYPYAVDGDEYFSLCNPSRSAVSIEGWEVTDGEGTVSVIGPILVQPLESVVFSFNVSSYIRAYSSSPSGAIHDLVSSDVCVVQGAFRMGNEGDSLTLRDWSGEVIDCVVYGDCRDEVIGWVGPSIPSPRAGEVIVRTFPSGGEFDTDSYADWMPFREHRYGYTSWKPFTVDLDGGDVTAFVSPDCAADVISFQLDAACEAIRVCSYEFSSPLICESLLRAIDRGVDVRLLVDGSPVGGIDDRATAALSVLARSGATVRILVGSLDDGIVRHVAAIHSKYMVMDSDRAIILSENAVPSGIPVDRVFGNRGWGVAVVSSSTASFLVSVFDEDCRSDRQDISDWRDDERYDPEAEAPAVGTGLHDRGMLAPMTISGPARMTIVLSPDGSVDGPFLCRYLHAEESLVIEQFQADLRWATRWSDYDSFSPLVYSVVDAARDGVSTRALFDSSWYNLERNEGVAEALLAISTSESLDLGAELIDRSSPITVMHNKGAVVDHRVSVVSSNNWVYASFAKNRELAAVVESTEVAGYFEAAFDSDWYPDVVPPSIDILDEYVVPLGSWVNLTSDGCSDDRLVVDVTWDVDADGRADARGSTLSLLLTSPGELSVEIMAVDAWGNEARRTISITVTADHLVRDDRPDYRACAFCGAIAGALAVVFAAKRNRGGRHPR